MHFLENSSKSTESILFWKWLCFTFESIAKKGKDEWVDDYDDVDDDDDDDDEMSQKLHFYFRVGK